MLKIDENTEDIYFPRGTEKEWQFIQFGFFPRGMGDIIFLALQDIIENNKTDNEAIKTFFECLRLLKKRKRWPDYMHKGVEHLIAKNSFEFYWIIFKNRKALKRYKLTGEYNKTPIIKYRPQRQMTRDPWTMMYCCAVHFGFDRYLKERMPIDIFRIKTWQWRRALLKKRNCYKLLDNILPKSKKDFVIVLNQYRRNAYNSVLTKN